MLSTLLSEIRRALHGISTRSEQYLIIGAVTFTTFFIGFGGGIVFPILPNLGVILGISPLLVGLILSANRFSRLLLSAPAGMLVDRIGTRTPFVAGMFIQAIGTFGYFLAMVVPGPPEIWFLLARILWGVGSALVFATAYTIAADVADAATRGSSMGLIRGGLLFGVPTGLVGGGLVAELASTIAAFLLAAALAFIASFVALAIIPETHVDEDSPDPPPGFNLDLSLPAVTAGAVNGALFIVYFGVVFSTLVLLLPDRDLGVFGLDAQGSSGLFMALTVITAGFFMFTGGLISDRFRTRVPILVFFLLLTAAGFVLLANAHCVASLTLATIAIGAGQGGTSGPLLALLADLTPKERMGRAVGTNNVLGDIGGGLGPILALPLVGIIGFQSLYLASASLPLLAIAILLVGVYRQTGTISPSIEIPCSTGSPHH